MKSTSRLFNLLAGAGLALFVLLGCASRQSPPTVEEVREGEALSPAPPVPAEPASTNSPTAPTVPSGAPVAAEPTHTVRPQDALTEAQIAKVCELANTAEVEQAKLAQTKAKAPAVKSFAAMMIKHHGEALQQQARIAKKLSINSEESETSAKLKADGEATLANLKKADAAGFDAAYIASQIDGHQKALDLLDTKLIPSAKTPEVTDALKQARSIVAQHLSDAKALQAK